jgi:hypothetical protein
MGLLSTGAYASRPVVLHDCGEQVRLYSDGWGFCPRCRIEFNGGGRQAVPEGQPGESDEVPAP